MSIWTNDRTTDIFRAEDTKKHFKCKDCLNFRYKRLLFGMDAGPCVSSCENADMFEYPNWESMKNNVVCKNYKKKQEIHASEGGSEMKARMLSHITYPGKNIIGEGVLNIGISVQKSVDDALLETLYRIYEKSDVASLYVIDEAEFGRFLEKYLPMWEKEERK